MQTGAGTVSYRAGAPALIAFGLVVLLVAGVLAVRDVLRSSGTPTVSGAVEEQGSGSRERVVDWSFVAGSPVAAVLARRPGLRPSDVVRSHAFGWTGPTLHEVTSQQQYLRLLRTDPTLSPVDLVRQMARGS